MIPRPNNPRQSRSGSMKIKARMNRPIPQPKNRPMIAFRCWSMVLFLVTMVSAVGLSGSSSLILISKYSLSSLRDSSFGRPRPFSRLATADLLICISAASFACEPPLCCLKPFQSITRFHRITSSRFADIITHHAEKSIFGSVILSVGTVTFGNIPESVTEN